MNGGFETPDLKSQDTAGKGWLNKAQDDVSGWKTTAKDGLIEFAWMTNSGTSLHMVPTTTAEIISGVGASDGVQFAEVIAGESSCIYQSLSLGAGKNYNWIIHHRGRAGVDTMALFIVEDTHVSHVKSEKTDTDRFNQIINWMKKNGVTAPAAGNMDNYTVYTTELLAGTAFAESSTGSYFSFTSDDEHTVKFEIQLMSTDTSDWGEYTGTYFSETEKDILFLFASFSSASIKESATSGNLIDHCGFLDSRGNNLLVNPGFEDVVITKSYATMKGANASSPTSGIGWCTTASDYLVEIGSLKYGNAYGLDIEIETTVLNAPSIREGNQFVELNANEESSLYQIVNTEPGKMYRWSLSHRGRTDVDTMALIIGPDQPYEPQKVSTSSRDQLMQIVDWLNVQTEMVLDIPERGCSDKITLYTSKFNSSGGWVLGSNKFSWKRDEEHTEEWSVWIISSPNDVWHDYGELDSEARYNYEYIVPKGHYQSVFGFVSINAKMANGTKNATYGNLLDNISFKEYYYIQISNATNGGGGMLEITNDDGTFIFDSTNAGWAFHGSDFSIHLKPGDRKIVGTYINGVFKGMDEWEYDEKKVEYVYHLSNTTSAVQVEIVYVAETVVYDTRNGYEYQYLYDPKKGSYSGGCEVPLGRTDVQGYIQEYTSHAPEAVDGWNFICWKYISPADSQTYELDAVHKVVYEERGGTFAIYKLLSGGGTEFVVGNIPYHEGITFFAVWEHRQRVVARTFNRNTSAYDINTEGGFAELTLVSGDASEKSDYTLDTVKVGEELYASDNAYINVTAHREVGYNFNGWYDASGNLVSNSISYTYRVGLNKVVELYASFEPAGYNISIRCSVINGDSQKYFAVNCTFTRLRENKVYSITGLNTDPITVDGERVTNTTLLRADASGNASVTLYMKHGQNANLIFLPENCRYSVSSNDYRGVGYNVRGEVSSKALTAAATVNLKYYYLSQSVLLEAGKHYAGILSGLSPDMISITENSSYTLEVATQYNPGIYSGLNLSLCFFDTSDAEKVFAAGTRMLMIDFTDAGNPKYYSYVVPDSSDPVSMIRIDKCFKEIGTVNTFYQPKTSSSTLLERLVFLIDYVGTSTSAESGRISLVYDDTGNDLINTVKPEKKTVEVGVDATELNVTAANAGNSSNVGPFALYLTVNNSTYTVNTAYENALYAVKLSVDGGTFPDGAYAEADGKYYYSNGGYITLSPWPSGTFRVDIYSPLPIVTNGGEVTFTVALFPAGSSSALRPEVKSTSVTFRCIDTSECAVDAEISTNGFAPGHIYSAEITLKYKNVDQVLLTVSRKNDDGTYTEIATDIFVNLPDDDGVFRVDLNNGFRVAAGETYLFTFVGCVDGLSVCHDVCYAVIGYGR